MVKKLQNYWKLIVTTILCVYWCGDVAQANPSLWRVVRRFLESEGNITQVPGSRSHQLLNESDVKEDIVKRARLRQRGTTEPAESIHLSTNLSKQKTKEGVKQKHRFLVEKDASASKHLSYKTYNHIENKVRNDTVHRSVAHYQEKNDDPVESKKKLNAESKPNPTEANENRLRAYKEADQKVHKQNQSNDTKLSIRAGRYRDSDEDTGTNRKSTTIRITKMYPAYQLQDDEEDSPRQPKPYGKDRLNPYAINEQMMRFMDIYKDSMNITMEVIGRTAEYNNIVLLKITEVKKDPDNYFRVNKYADEPPEKKIIFIVHGLAVRGMGVLLNSEATFEALMSYYAAHLPYFDIFVIPIANPDGFTAILNGHHGKYWNKNMSPQASCSGVMLDRNFDVEWNSSHRISPCSHVYPGPAPFSEPETRAVRDVLHLYSQKIIAYIHVHASTYGSSIFKGDAILFPRGYTSIQNEDDKYMDIKGEVEESLKNATFRVISVAVETLHSWYGKVVGSSVDYASTVYGIPYAMEFCMQIYDKMQEDALYQIWRRIIDVAFKSIWNSLNNGNNN